jgi:Domain of unknown function (DUF4112)
LPPVGGDLLTGFVQAGLVLVALKHFRLPRAVAARMMCNVLLNIAVSEIPLLGDMLEVVFKANTPNLKHLEQYRRNRRTLEVIPAPKPQGGRSPGFTGRHTVDARPGATPWRYLPPISSGRDNNVWSASKSTGFTMWLSKPASRERRRSSSMP